MAGTLRSALHPQRSRLILSAWLVLSTCFRKIMWPTNTFSFCIATRLRKLFDEWDVELRNGVGFACATTEKPFRNPCLKSLPRPTKPLSIA